VDINKMHTVNNIEFLVIYLVDLNQVTEWHLDWIVWVTVDRGEQSPYYAGVGTSEILVNKKNKIAFKSMAEHVGNMEKSLKGKIIVEHMDEKSKSILKDFLENFEEGDLWENSTEELKNSLA